MDTWAQIDAVGPFGTAEARLTRRPRKAAPALVPTAPARLCREWCVRYLPMLVFGAALLLAVRLWTAVNPQPPPMPLVGRDCVEPVLALTCDKP